MGQPDRALNLLRLSENELLDKYEHMVNLKIFLMNRKCIILKMSDQEEELQNVLKDIFFHNLALKGYMSPDNIKHLSNALLSMVYGNRMMARVLIDHLLEDPELPKFFLPTIRFYNSLLLSLEVETTGKALD